MNVNLPTDTRFPPLGLARPWTTAEAEVIVTAHASAVTSSDVLAQRAERAEAALARQMAVARADALIRATLQDQARTRESRVLALTMRAEQAEARLAAIVAAVTAAGVGS